MAEGTVNKKREMESGIRDLYAQVELLTAAVEKMSAMIGPWLKVKITESQAEGLRREMELLRKPINSAEMGGRSLSLYQTDKENIELYAEGVAEEKESFASDMQARHDAICNKLIEYAHEKYFLDRIDKYFAWSIVLADMKVPRSALRFALSEVLVKKLIDALSDKDIADGLLLDVGNGGRVQRALDTIYNLRLSCWSRNSRDIRR